MKIVNFLLSALALIFLLMAMCAKPNYNNPLDRGGTNFAGDGPAGDLDNDGIANMFDPDAPPEYRQHSTPSITLLGPDTIVIAQYDPKHLADGLQTMATATDPLYGNLDSNIVMTGDFFTSQCNTYTLTYTVHNMANDIATKQRVVIVDCEGPVITLNGRNPMEINVGKPYNEPGATAYDSVDRQTKTVAISGAPSTAIVHDDSVVYSAVDNMGNKSSVTRLVIITKIDDITAPVIELIGSADTTIILGIGNYKDPGVKAIDNVDGDISNKVTTSGGVNVGKIGNYTIFYNVSDEAGNSAATISRIVRVKDKPEGPDNTPPEITLLGKGYDTVKVGGVWTEPGYTVWDDRDTTGLGAAVKVTITAQGGAVVPKVTTTAETYFTLTYTVNDTAGNPSNPIQRFVIVSNKGPTDNIKPVIKLEGKAKDSTMQGTPYVDPGATATDSVPGNPMRINLSNSITRVVKDSMGSVVSFDLFYISVGIYSIIYSVSDDAGNKAEVTRIVSVKDTSALPPDSMFARYGVPLPDSLPDSRYTYSDTVLLDGPAALVPKMTSIREFRMDWDGKNKQINQFSLSTKGGTFMNFMPNGTQYRLTQSFGKPEPKFTISGSGIQKLDGEYYIKPSAKECVWVRTDGSFAIIFK